MKLEEVLLLAIPVTFFAMLLVERLKPARSYPPIPRWGLVGVAMFLMMLAVSIVVPLLLPVAWLEAHRLFDATRLGVVPGVIVGYAIVSLLSMAYHRTVHKVHFLWRWTHQTHHAPQRLDMLGAAYFHPFDIINFTVVQVVALTLVVGLDPRAAAITGFVATFYSFFQHWNVRTPRFLGYFIQRPESHAIHHGRGVHGFNYSDLPLWDVLFGTFKNPESHEGEVGFDGPASLVPLLLGRDVNAQPEEEQPPVSVATAE